MTQVLWHLCPACLTLVFSFRKRIGWISRKSLKKMNYCQNLTPSSRPRRATAASQDPPAGQAGLPSCALQAMLTADPATPIAAAESTTTAMVPHSQGALLNHPRTSARSRASP